MASHHAKHLHQAAKSHAEVNEEIDKVAAEVKRDQDREAASIGERGTQNGNAGGSSAPTE